MPYCLLMFALFAVAFVWPSTTSAGLLVSGYNSNSVASYADDGTYLGDFVAPGSGGLSGPEGLVFGPDGNLYVASLNNNRIIKFDGTNGAFLGIFASEGMTLPQGLVFDGSGNLYVAGGGTNNVARFDSSGTWLGDFVSRESGGLMEADGIAFGPDGNLYVAGTLSQAIHRYNGLTGEWMENYELEFRPSGFTFGADGDIFIANGNRVQRIDGLTGADKGIFAAYGGYGFLDVEFGADGILYASDYSITGRIVRFDGTTGAFIDELVAASPGWGPTYLLHREVAAVPEPGSLTLLCLGALGLIGVRRCGRKVFTESDA